MDPSALLLALLLTGPPWPEPDPTDADLLRFPSESDVRLQLRVSERFEREFHQTARLAGWPSEQVARYSDWLFSLREPWEALLAAYTRSDDGQPLARLKVLLGPQRWWAGALPPILPEGF